MTISPRELLRQEVHVVPAQPGFNRITPVHGDGFDVIDICRSPVVGWCVEVRVFLYRDGFQHTESTTVPITAGTNCGLYDDWALEHPDGRCYLPFVSPRDRMLESAAELLRHWQKEPRAPTTEDACDNTTNQMEEEAW